jgi:hypothetical protein
VSRRHGAETSRGLDEGAVDMWFLDVPVEAVPASVVVVAQAASARVGAGATSVTRTAGVCRVVWAGKDVEFGRKVYADLVASDYMYRYERKELDFRRKAGGSIRVVRPPSFGRYDVDSDRYFPNADYVGPDSFLVEVERDGVVVNVRYFVDVMQTVTRLTEEYSCIDYKPKNSDGLWKISDAFVYGNESGTVAGLLERASRYIAEFSSLGGAALASTVLGAEARITFDIDAAGYGWFMDATPHESSEYLPTADPNVLRRSAKIT